MRVLVVSTMRDEGPHLLEWVAHHRAIGVTDFLIFTNDCSDGTDAMLDALARLGVVRVANTPPPGKSLQWNALKQAWRHDLRKAADWIMCIDCDEFVNLRDPLDTLGDLILRVGDADAVAMPWRLFGHNGQRRLTDAPTTRLFTRCAPADCAYPVGATQFKTLFRARGPFGRIGVHRPRLKSGGTARWVDGSGTTMPEEVSQNEHRLALFALNCGSKLIQLNHYSLRSAESFLLKRQRGLPNRAAKAIDLTYWVERNFNAVEDRSIDRLRPGTEAELTRILALPGVADLHHRAHAHHHAMFEQAMRNEAEVQLYGRLLLAADSTPLPPGDVADLVARFQAAHG